MQTPATRHLADSVRRYLSAIESAAQHVRRREQANCRNFLRYLDEVGRLDESTVETWICRSGSARSEVRRRRLSTIRRLLAMTPGPDAERIAGWLDTNRKHLMQSDQTAKVVAIRPASETHREDAEQLADKAHTLHAEGEIDRAEALARHALAQHPACLRAHALLGVIQLEAQRPEAALNQFRQALVLSGDPYDRDGIEGITDVLAGLGRTLMTLDCLDEAFDVYNRLRLSRTAHAITARAALGRIAFLKDEVDTAATWFSQCEPLLQYNVYLARSVQGERFQAAIALSRALIANPLLPCSLIGLNQTYTNMWPDEARRNWSLQARSYTDDWGELWLRWPGIVEGLRQDYESPAIRKFMMRIATTVLENPTSPRLAVWIHRAASTLNTTKPETGSEPAAAVTRLATPKTQEPPK